MNDVMQYWFHTEFSTSVAISILLVWGVIVIIGVVGGFIMGRMSK